MLVLASVTSSITGWIAENGLYAVFALMAVDALFPVGGELVMLYAGVLAAGAVTGHSVSLFGATLTSGAESYIALALAGTLGYLLGACFGWELGRRGGRALLVRHGRWLHLSEANLVRAEAWFERYGRAAVLLGRVTPVVRSFISIPAGSSRRRLAHTSHLRPSARLSGASASRPGGGRSAAVGRNSTTPSATPTT
jgi:membrane protein DedA with SNARE-associated domain